MKYMTEPKEAMMEYDDYERLCLLAERIQDRKNNRYYDYRDPECPYDEEGEDDDE